MSDPLFQWPHEPGAPAYSVDYLRQRCRQAVAHWIARAQALADVQRLDPGVPEVAFDLRGLNAGMACVPNKGRAVGRIRINEELLRRYPREMIQHTVPHEVAHLVTYRLFGKMDHGPEWRSVMAHFGKPPTRCHQMKARPARQHRKYRYLCSCREHVVGPQVNARIRRGHIYTCRKCAQPLRLAA